MRLPQQGSLFISKKKFEVPGLIHTWQSVVYTRQLNRFVTTPIFILTTFVFALHTTPNENIIRLYRPGHAALNFVTTETKAKAKTGIAISLDSAQTVESAKLLLIRLDGINGIDKSRLTTSETKALRNELRLIKGELKELHKGTYMPVGKLAILLLVPFIVFNITH